MSNDPRQTALWALTALETAPATLDRVMATAFEAAPHLDRRDRALTNALVYGVQRWRGRLDWIIAHFSRTPLARMDPSIRNLLRLGLFQIAFMERIPVSAAVNTAVEMAKQTATPWAARFVNGVLRNAARGLKGVPFPDLSSDPVDAVAAGRAFPLPAGWSRAGCNASGSRRPLRCATPSTRSPPSPCAPTPSKPHAQRCWRRWKPRPKTPGRPLTPPRAFAATGSKKRWPNCRLFSRAGARLRTRPPSW